MQPESAKTEPGPGDKEGRPTRCARCGRENAATAKICVGCGAQVADAPGATGGPPDALPDPVSFRPLPKRDPQFLLRAAVASGVVLVVLVGAVYFIYMNFFLADFSPAYTRRMPASDERKEAAPGPAAAGKLVPPPVVHTPAPQAATPSLPQEKPVLAPRAAVPSTAAPRPAPAPSKAPGKAPPPRAAVKPAAAATAKPADIAVESCTEALAAIGLCVAGAAPQARARTPAQSVPPPAAGARTTPCEDGVAALGLCAPATNPRKE